MQKGLKCVGCILWVTVSHRWLLHLTKAINLGDRASPPKYVVGDTNVDIPPKVSARGVDIVHMVLWHNAIIVAFSSESDSAGNTELMPILSNSEEIRSWA